MTKLIRNNDWNLYDAIDCFVNNDERGMWHYLLEWAGEWD